MRHSPNLKLFAGSRAEWNLQLLQRRAAAAAGPPSSTPGEATHGGGGALWDTSEAELTGSPSLSRLSKKYFTDSPWDKDRKNFCYSASSDSGCGGFGGRFRAPSGSDRKQETLREDASSL